MAKKAVKAKEEEVQEEAKVKDKPKVVKRRYPVRTIIGKRG